MLASSANSLLESVDDVGSIIHRTVQLRTTRTALDTRIFVYTVFHSYLVRLVDIRIPVLLPLCRRYAQYARIRNIQLSILLVGLFASPSQSGK